ncbi:MAG: hypothetical protein E6767_00330 [Dysgonomonas sp.]|nr:hypothetical protein [Dysgonomonas sp.]
MTEKDKKLLAELETRMRQLMYLYNTLEDENAQLKQQLAEKDSAIEVLHAESEQLKTKYENLKFAKSFSSGNENEMQEAKRRLSKLVREVDKCIAMLKT